jgi:hypothetical protein
MVSPNLRSYKVKITAVTISVAEVCVDAINEEEAFEIGKIVANPEDFEVTKLISIEGHHEEVI